eukprot:CAMPEP_0181397456 /NCGR_PEP_ID=MMETSP1110-20121109/494_1 /TAXON_ID=174948 /ORGANISM="Symbiodinium sp., Strain CCMP421" /LENGTH=67 /DNA_ID=CAMNT_0023519295 /DNA_START=532 /DNA_END=733 /DNA_ORIENTATION=-
MDLAMAQALEQHAGTDNRRLGISARWRAMTWPRYGSMSDEPSAGFLDIGMAGRSLNPPASLPNRFGT